MKAFPKGLYGCKIAEKQLSWPTLVFSVAGGMDPIATTFYKRLASLLSDKTHQTYNQTIRWLRCSLSFSLLRSMIMCLRGARSSCGKPQLAAGDIALAVSEARLM